MTEKQFPQIPRELVSPCLFALDMFQAIMEMEDMCNFKDFPTLFFLISPDCQIKPSPNSNGVYFLTNRDQ